MTLSLTQQLGSAYQHLLRQLYAYYNITEGVVPATSQDGRDTLYGLLREQEARADEPLVVILDALDEAESPFAPPFPTPLPSNVYVIVTARADALDTPAYLEGWLPVGERGISSQRYTLVPELSTQAIAEWLALSDEVAVQERAKDEDFIHRLHENTDGGYPLYLRYLIEDLEQAASEGGDLEALLDEIRPVGFQTYVTQQVKKLGQLSALRDPVSVRRLLAFLSVAHGPLSSQDIETLTGISPWSLPWQVMRWLAANEKEDTYAFAHPRLAQAFREVPQLRANEAVNELRVYCLRWHDYESKYALRHVATHLLDAITQQRENVQAREQLYELVRTNEFLQKQAWRLPEEPDLPSRTMLAALNTAWQAKDLAEVASITLRHAYWAERERYRSPRSVLKQTGSVKAALTLADLASPTRRVCWYLLFAWELGVSQQVEKARNVLDRLQQDPLPRIDNHDAPLAILLCVWLLPMMPDRLAQICGAIFDSTSRAELIRTYYSNHPGSDDESVFAALWHINQTLNVENNDDALVAIAKAQAKARWFFAALDTAQLIADNEARHIALLQIKLAQAKTGLGGLSRREISSLADSIGQLKKRKIKEELLAEIAVVYAKKNLMYNSLAVAKGLWYDEWKAYALAEIARVRIDSGDLEAAQQMLEAALAAVQQIEDEGRRGWVLVGIARAQIEAGDQEGAQQMLEAALAAVQQIKDEELKGILLIDIAKLAVRLENISPSTFICNSRDVI